MLFRRWVGGFMGFALDALLVIILIILIIRDPAGFGDWLRGLGNDVVHFVNNIIIVIQHA
jgi:hypothetical protein